MEKRTYRLRRRAEQQEQTRRRIVEALVALHGEVGPRATTVSAVAERAGVERLTVYRHFPDAAAMLQACTTHWLAENPLPTLPDTVEGRDPAVVAEAFLVALYRYYQRNERMLDNSHRDAPAMPELQAVQAGFEARLADARDELLVRWRATGARRQALRAVLGHALAFPAWRSLRRERLSATAAAALVRRWLESVEA